MTIYELIIIAREDCRTIYYEVLSLTAFGGQELINARREADGMEWYLNTLEQRYNLEWLNFMEAN